MNVEEQERGMLTLIEIGGEGKKSDLFRIWKGRRGYGRQRLRSGESSVRFEQAKSKS
jgi:hypothetical protein